MSESGSMSTVSGESQSPAQRRFARANVDIEVHTCRDRDERETVGRVRNLGGGGLRVVNNDDLQREETLSLRFHLPGVERAIQAHAKVVLSFYDASEELYAHGLAFTRISPADQEVIMQFVASVEHQEPDIVS